MQKKILIPLLLSFLIPTFMVPAAIEAKVLATTIGGTACVAAALIAPYKYYEHQIYKALAIKDIKAAQEKIIQLKNSWTIIPSIRANCIEAFLIMFVRTNNLEMVKWMLEEKIIDLSTMPTAAQRQAFFHTWNNPDLKIAYQLYKHGLDPKTVFQGAEESPLIPAVNHLQVVHVKFYLLAGVPVNCTGSLNTTALDWLEHPFIKKIVKDKQGNSPPELQKALDAHIDEQRKIIKELLIKHGAKRAKELNKD